MSRLLGQVGGQAIVVAEFGRLDLHCPYIAVMPQWDFLDFLADHARTYPNFHLRMNAKVTGLIEDQGASPGFTLKHRTGRCRLKQRSSAPTPGLGRARSGRPDGAGSGCTDRCFGCDCRANPMIPTTAWATSIRAASFVTDQSSGLLATPMSFPGRGGTEVRARA